MSEEQHVRTGGCATRRAALGIAGGSVLLGTLAACGGGGDSGKSGGGGDAGGGSSAEESAEPGGGGSTALAKVDDIPVGGGKVFKKEMVVVTQPEAGTILAFSAECTHEGCPVGEVADGLIKCPCHGSEFDIKDGAVRGGPAQDPLPEKKVTVTGDEITLA